MSKPALAIRKSNNLQLKKRILDFRRSSFYNKPNKIVLETVAIDATIYLMEIKDRDDIKQT